MIRLEKDEQEEEAGFPMSEMRPFQTCRIIGSSIYGGEIVMRTASLDHFEVMNISNPRADGCWSKNNMRVIPITEPLTLTLLPD